MLRCDGYGDALASQPNGSRAGNRGVIDCFDPLALDELTQSDQGSAESVPDRADDAGLTPILTEHLPRPRYPICLRDPLLVHRNGNLIHQRRRSKHFRLLPFHLGPAARSVSQAGLIPLESLFDGGHVRSYLSDGWRSSRTFAEPC